MKTSISAAILLILMTYGVKAQDDWFVKLEQMAWLNRVHKVKILESTRQQAEQILGTPDDLGYKGIDSIDYYTLENGRVTLTYTTEECNSINGKVEKNVVEEIIFSPTFKITFKSLKINLQEFKKSVESDVPSLFIYENKKNGIEIYVEFGNVNSIVFTPPEKQKFECFDKQ